MPLTCSNHTPTCQEFNWQNPPPTGETRGRNSHMSYKSMKNWDRGSREPLLSKITERVHHQEPLKERISQVVYKLKVQQNRLEGANMKTQQHDKTLFDKCVQAQMNHDTARSTMYANEIAEIRKMAKITLRSELALEQVGLRLETIQEFGDVAATMGPIAGVVATITRSRHTREHGAEVARTNLFGENDHAHNP